jgi:hypothetical protein
MWVDMIGGINATVFALVLYKSIIVLVRLVKTDGAYKTASVFATVFTMISCILFGATQFYLMDIASQFDEAVIWLWSAMNFFVSSSFLIYTVWIDIWTSITCKYRRKSEIRF